MYLGLLEAPSGVWERDDPGLDRGELGADGFFHCEGKHRDQARRLQFICAGSDAL